MGLEITVNQKTKTASIVFKDTIDLADELAKVTPQHWIVSNKSGKVVGEYSREVDATDHVARVPGCTIEHVVQPERFVFSDEQIMLAVHRKAGESIREAHEAANPAQSADKIKEEFEKAQEKLKADFDKKASARSSSTIKM